PDLLPVQCWQIGGHGENIYIKAPPGSQAGCQGTPPRVQDSMLSRSCWVAASGVGFRDKEGQRQQNSSWKRQTPPLCLLQ
uniref:Uncharacterized protein n=1 Tax=Otus sunia TaxID=257818 RepID=A0A8C8E4S1_9STRI